jgi:hypothetical protein
MPTPSLVIRLRHSPAFAAKSHGWCRLAPFDLDIDRLAREGTRFGEAMANNSICWTITRAGAYCVSGRVFATESGTLIPECPG